MQYPPYSFQQLCSWLSHQEHRIRELEKTVSQLQAELQTLRQSRAIHVERIEYKFDQLKVERLDGTLTIGISPSDSKSSIEDLVINDKEMQPVVTKASETYQRIYDRADHFVRQTCPAIIQRLETEHQLIVGSDYRNLMLEDLSKQIGKRIQHYLNAEPYIQMEDPTDAISEKMESDIRSGIEQHFQQALKKEAGP